MKNVTMKMMVMLIAVMMISTFVTVAFCEEEAMEEATLQEVLVEEIPVQEVLVTEDSADEAFIPEEEFPIDLEELKEAFEEKNEKMTEKEGTVEVLEEINTDDIKEETKEHDVSIKLVSQSSPVFLGDEVTLVAQTEVICQFQWQCSRDGGMTWEDAAGETGQEMTIILSKANANNIWRVEASF